jgi:hypothetical protein
VEPLQLVEVEAQMTRYEAIIDVGPRPGTPEIADEDRKAVGDEIAENLAAAAGSDPIADLRIVVSPVGAIVLVTRSVPADADPAPTLRAFVRQALAAGRFADWQMLTSSVTALHGD